MATALEVEYESMGALRVLSDGTRIFEARGPQGTRFSVKVPARGRVSADDTLGYLRRELEVGRRLPADVVLRPHACGTWHGEPALVLDLYPCDTLDTLLRAPLPAARFLDLAVPIARALAEVHRSGFLHRDVKPENILVGRAGVHGTVRLTGLRLATELPGGRGGAAALVEGTLAYLSPEQTGRMSRTVDQRSDLYALGVTFFQMLAGQLPFQAADSLEWIHCHIARPPPPLRGLVPSVPPLLAELVRRLLAKAPEERYQTARGLAQDLVDCRARLAPDGTIAPFELGAADIPERFQVPERLYGRERELAALTAVFARVAAGGGPALALVRGGAGSGKSRLVRALEERVLAHGGAFRAGKFDQQKPNVPYATFVDAFRELVLEQLTVADDALAGLRERLVTTLGPNARLVVDVIPELALVIGSPPEVSEVPPAEAQNRFRIVLRQFVGELARARGSLALFLDDLQWADDASLVLLHDLLVHPDLRNLLIVGAYRDGEVGADHPLRTTLGRLGAAGLVPTEIELGPLSTDELERLVGDTLRCPPPAARPLAAIVARQTGGNPFFAIQLLTDLHDERLLELEAGAFRWNVDAIRARGLTDNVVDLMVERLRRRDAPTRTALEHLACIGSRADLGTLAKIQGRSPADTEAALRPAVAAGLLSVSGDTYQFVHDRVQEAAYSLVVAPVREEMHLRIGRVLASDLPPDGGPQLFDVVNQQNRGVALLLLPEERAALATLNYRAGIKAKSAIAHASAQAYLRTAAELLPGDAWETRYEETFALHLALTECEFMLGRHGEAEALFSLLRARARSHADRANATVLFMRLYQLAGRPNDAVTLLVEALEAMGEHVPTPEEAIPAMLRERDAIEALLGGRRVEQLAFAPLATDPEARARITLYVTAMPCTNIARPELFPLVVVRALRCALEHGNTEDACFAFSAYGSLLVGLFGDIPGAFAFAELAIDLNERLGDLRWRGSVLYLYAHFIHSWGRPYAALRPTLEKILPALYQAGDLLFAAYHLFQLAWQTLERGDAIDDMMELVSAPPLEITLGTERGIVSHIAVHRQLLRALRGETRTRGSFDDAEFDEAGSLRTLAAAKISILTAYFHVAKQVVMYLFGDLTGALAHADAVRPLRPTIGANAAEAIHHFFFALAIVTLDDPNARAARQEELEESVAKVAGWATTSPENFGSRHALLGAERARLEGRDSDAITLYERAIAEAHANGLVHYEAIALERAAAYFRAKGAHRAATAYLRDAHACYATWGAREKLAELEERFPDAFAEPRASRAFDTVEPHPRATFAALPDSLDFRSVVEALQTISGTLVIDDLVRALLRIVLEQGGAERSVLLLAARDERPTIEADAEVSGEAIVVRRAEAARLGSRVPQGIVDYVWRTGSRVLLEDALARNRFSGDPYLAAARPRTLLCLPIVRQAKTVGLLYLENRLVAGAFTEGRLSVLELLAAQAAISLESAKLYTNLARENAERRAAERATALSEERFRLLVDGVKDSALFMLDRDGFVASWNAGAERLFGWVAEEIRGRPAAALYPREALATPHAAEDALVEAARSGAFEQSATCQRKDQSRFVADVLVTALHDEAGALTSYSVLVRDRTQHVRLEDQLRQAQKMEAIGRLAGGIAHDFNNLLAAVYGYVHRGLRRVPPGSLVGTDLLEIEAVARKAGELTKQLLAFARKQQTEARAIDLNDLVRRAETLLQRVLGDDIELTTVTAPSLDPIEADPGQIEQVLLNLAVNARDAMPRGGTLTLETANVELGADYAARHADVRPGSFVVLAITDTGVGMTPEVMAHLFEPFFTTKGPAEGTGLGLATSYGIVKQAGGHIWVYSEPGRGTTFKIYLPRSHRAPTRARPPSTPPPPARGETILLVEDHENLRKLVAESLESVGYQVLVAAGGREAIDLAARHERPIDLLITDLVMPKMGGLELAAALEPSRPGMKVLCVSGYTEASLGDRRPGGRVQFLSKPFTPDELAKKVRTVLDTA